MSVRKKPDHLSIGGRLRAERKRLRLSQVETGAFAGCTSSTITDWELGRTSPTANALAELAAAGFRIEYIVTGHPGLTEMRQSAEAIVGLGLGMFDKAERRKFLAEMLATAMLDGVGQ